MPEGRSGTNTGGRTDAGSIIAELWAEREEAIATAPRHQPQAQRTQKRPPAQSRPKASGTERALATAVIVLLMGGALGTLAVTQGVIGAPSKATFVARADAICVPGNGVAAAIPKPSTYPALATAASALVTTANTQIGQLRALELPSGADRGRARAVLAAMTATSQAGVNLQAAAAATDDARTATASRSLDVFAKDVVAKAGAYGFKACVAGMQPGIAAVLGGANGLVKQEFVTKANTLCRTAIQSVETLPKPKAPAGVSAYVTSVNGLMDRLLGDLKALPVPVGDDAAVAEMLGGMATGNAKAKELFVALIASDTARTKALQSEIDLLDVAANIKYDAYGITDCGTNG